MRGPLPAPEGRDRGSDAEQHGTSRAGGRASAEGAASRRVASDFGAVGAGRAFTDRRQQVGAAGGRSRRAAFVGSEPSPRRRVRVARLCTRVVRGSPSRSGVTGQLLGRTRPFSPRLSRPEAPPPIDSPPGCTAKPRADPLRPRVWPPDPTPSVSHEWFLRRRVQSAPERVAATRPPAGARPNALTL